MNRCYLGLLVVGIGVSISFNPSFGLAAHLNFDPSNLISDGEFVDIDGLTEGETQAFLEMRDSYLKEFSENGRSAAQIIFGAAHGNGDASHTNNGIKIDQATGTVNPKAILVTLEKEQGLISKKSRDDNALRKAMGFACPDSGGCNPEYAGFTKQVEVGAWQLRYNFERAQGRGFSDYQVGQEFCFDDSHAGKGTNCGRYENRATTALYRYTPHVYNGNHRFNELYFELYKFQNRFYDSRLTSQSAYPNLWPGQSAHLSVGFRNVGSGIWDSLVRLAVDRGWEPASRFSANNWLSTYRIAKLSSTAQSGGTVNFSVPVTIPQDTPTGTEHRFQVRLVRDGTTWLEGDGAGAWWLLRIPKPTAELVNQSPYVTLKRGQDATLTVIFRNTSGVSWPTNGFGAVRLAVDKFWANRTAWQGSGWLFENRITTAKEGVVSDGGLATYQFYIHVPSDMPSGEHRFYVRLVADGLNGGWFENPDYNGAAWWKINVID